ALVEGVEAVDPVGIHQRQACRLGMNVRAAGEWLGCLRMVTRRCFGYDAGCLVLGHVTGLELRDHHPFDPGLGEPRHIVCRQQVPLLESRFPPADAVRKHRAGRLLHGNLAEDHCLPPLSSLSARVTSARIEMAISAGPRAPISRPMGAWMRASSASLKPAALRRSSRVEWVRLLPRAPI